MALRIIQVRHFLKTTTREQAAHYRSILADP